MADNTVVFEPLYTDKNRNGVLPMHALGRWCNIPKSLSLKAAAVGKRGFVFAAHTTFDSVSACLYQASWSSFVNIPLITSAYFTEYNNSSYYTAKHVKKQGMDKYIGYEIMLNVSMNRMIRKKQSLTTKFKQMIDSMWNKYPKALKPKYFKSKNILLTHLNELKRIKMNKLDNDELIYSYKIPLRYVDEDINYHLTARKYHILIEEALMNYDIKMATNKYVNYSMSIAYWKETRVSKYSHCFVNICKKNNILMMNERNSKFHTGWDIFGVLSVCRCCERCDDTKQYHQNQQHQHEWIHQTGFVIRVLDKKPRVELTNSKL